jgi:DNA helicase HerA-like ATPase
MANPSLVDPDQYIGTITFANASLVQANLPQATARPERRGLARGAVGDFVFIDCETYKLLGRIVEVRIPDVERLSLEPSLGEQPTPNPIGRIQLLATVEQTTQKLNRGVKIYPRIGDGVFLARQELFAQLVANTTNSPEDVTLDLGTLDAAGGVSVKVSAEKLFGRHCGILGATGGGKSWTLTSLWGKSNPIRSYGRVRQCSCDRQALHLHDCRRGSADCPLSIQGDD